ncbi:MAG: hypothetical protein H6944_14965 [Zoogloeaceae bacterium]|uniref:hypothetical protein n=1 Tax=Denitromonas sp. TaxID=2734609 RepID=UPI001D23BC0C|nr:hypothetical protein [Rhodocyclaceae bacterium]MCP5222975.1 hypothetical protein [Zoogloeaceae bacterium]
MDENPAEGTRRVINNRLRVYYGGYWIKVYDPPEDTLATKKKLIGALTRRLFNHVEHGINIPGFRLEAARAAYEAETDEAMRRVKGGMLAGALFNRAADIFTKLVELQALGVEIGQDNPLMRQCGACLQKALELGRFVNHISGEEGIDELWGEPFRAFSIPVEDFYESRYIKIAQAMRDIDKIAAAMIHAFTSNGIFAGVEPLVHAYTEAAREKCETLRTDPAIFDIWPAFVVAGEQMNRFAPRLPARPVRSQVRNADTGLELMRAGTDLLIYITRARVPMPKSTREFVEKCNAFADRWAEPACPPARVA